MSATPNLTHSQPRAPWIDAFMMRLGALAPEMAPAEALRCAEDTFDDAADLGPLETAEIYAPRDTAGRGWRAVTWGLAS